MEKKKLLRITTVPMALAYPLRGQPSYMHDHGFDVLMISADGKELAQLQQNEHCPHMVVPMTRSITPFQDIRCIFMLVRIFKKERPEIVHTETPKAGLLGMIAAKITGVKIRIHTVAGLPLMVEKGLKLLVLRMVEKITYGAAMNVWPNSPSLKNYILLHRFTSPGKINVVGKGSSNGVDTKRFNKHGLQQEIFAKIKKELGFNEEHTYLLFIGRLVKDKGISELVNVFSTLQQTRSDLHLILVGQYEPHLDPLPPDIVNKINRPENIIHVEWTDKVEYYMGLADIFVFPSYREGFPNVLLEAAAMNLPIVCSRIAGNVDIVAHNETGIIFESQNEQDLQEKLSDALLDPEHMKQMAGKLARVITANFNREKFWAAMHAEYEKLLGG